MLEQWTTSVRAYPGVGTTGWGRFLSARLNPAPVVDPLPGLAVAAPANPFDPQWAAYFKARNDRKPKDDYHNQRRHLQRVADGVNSRSWLHAFDQKRSCSTLTRA